MTPVSSSSLERVGYELANQKLRIQFKDGRLYEYFDVPQHIYQRLVNPPDGSHGQYFNANIKGQYRYTRL
jgi:KTSC domain